MDPIFFEEHSCEENELENTVVLSCLCCNFSNEKASGRRKDFIGR
jgi:hypothetical protein